MQLWILPSHISRDKRVHLRIEDLPLSDSHIEKSLDLTSRDMIHLDDFVITPSMTRIEWSAIESEESVGEFIRRPARWGIGRDSEQSFTSVSDLLREGTYRRTLWSITTHIHRLRRTLEFPVHDRIAELVDEDDLIFLRDREDIHGWFFREDFPLEDLIVMDPSDRTLEDLHPLPLSWEFSEIESSRWEGSRFMEWVVFVHGEYR